MQGCQHGAGRNCWSSASNLSFLVTGAQRIQHGSVRVLKDMKDVWVQGLRNLGVSADLVNDPTTGHERCQLWCYSNVRCEYWQYNAKGCWVHDPDYAGQVSQPLYPLTTASGGAVLKSVPGANTEVLSLVRGEYLQHYCPTEPTLGIPASKEVPTTAFPGVDVFVTNAAWPRGYQPASLAVWPFTEPLGVGTGKKYTACAKTTVLASKANDWPGRCLGLTRIDLETSNAMQCQAFCHKTPACAVWQFNADQTCWYGLGTDCWNRNGDQTLKVLSAERVQHGDVRVVKSMKKLWVQGLYSLGLPTSADVDIAVSRCKHWCYSNFRCQYWQYGEGGCWVENPDESKSAQYPLTHGAGGALYSAGAALTMVDGEYIQHLCTPEEPIASRGETASGEWSFGEKALGCLSLLVVGGLVSFFAVWCLCGQNGRSPAKTRAVKKTRAVNAPPLPEQKPLMEQEVPMPDLFATPFLPSAVVAPAPFHTYAPMQAGQFPVHYLGGTQNR